jgi:UDP-N-acetylmuramate--alanine ligase
MFPPGRANGQDVSNGLDFFRKHGMTDGMETRSQDQAHAEAVSFVGRRIHLIGISGSGMRALAQMLLDRGAVVSGSDSCGNGVAERLREQGATIHTGQRPENLPETCDIVVFSSAIGQQNPELLAACRRGVEVVKYAEMLGRLMSEKVGVAISGTHGKSTTTAMVAYVLRQADFDPSFIVGATVEQLGGPSGVGRGKHFVAEACEFDRNFLHLRPTYAAILNVEEDHLDCYRDLPEIIEAFRAFGSLVAPGGVLVVNGEDRSALKAVRGAICDVETFGLKARCHWRGLPRGEDRGRVRLLIRKDGRDYAEFFTPLPGVHNACNALAATALLHHAGVGPESIAKFLPTFTGTRRRMTLKRQVDGISVVDDYAHHPTEIQATLKALRSHYEPRRVLCIFQPHQHSRTRFLLKDFASSFALADEVIVPDIYFVRDSEAEKDYVSSEDLVEQIRLRGGSARYMPSFSDIVRYVQDAARADDLIVTMGAGNIWEVADEIVRGLGSRR